MNSSILTGYGPSRNTAVFDGDESNYELWETKMLAYMKIRKLKSAMLPGENDIISNDKKEEAFSELLFLLDERSQCLIMRDAKDDGQKALEILRAHYAGFRKQQIISLYITLTSLSKQREESITDYFLRAEKAATALKNGGQVISDDLMVAMVLKGLPPKYKPFEVVINQQKKAIVWSEFKISLKNYEENYRDQPGISNVVMKMDDMNLNANENSKQRRNGDRQQPRGSKNNNNNGITCFKCNKPGHKAPDCNRSSSSNQNVRNKRWCNFCKSNTHFEKDCRNKKKHTANQLVCHDNEPHAFSFYVSVVRNTDRASQSGEDTDEPREDECCEETQVSHSFDIESDEEDDPEFKFTFELPEIDESEESEYESDDEFEANVSENVALEENESLENENVALEENESIESENVIFEENEYPEIQEKPSEQTEIEENQEDEVQESITLAFVLSEIELEKKVVDVRSCLETSTTEMLLVDSGCSSHINNDESNFISFDKDYEPEEHSIELADGSHVKNVAKKRGTVVVNLRDENNKIWRTELHNTLYIPTFPQNLFSVKRATSNRDGGNNGAKISFQGDSGEMISNGVKFPIKTVGNLYYLNKCTETNKQRSASLEEWHKILGHANKHDILKLENTVDDMKITHKQEFQQCETCIMSKATNNRNHHSDKRATSPLELIHTDLAGPIDPIAKDGFKYVMNFIDDYSSMTTVYFLKMKSDAPTALKKYLADCAPYGDAKKFRSDNGGEYISEEFAEILLDEKKRHEFTAPYSPHQNGTAERSWRTLFEMARAMLLEAQLPRYLWTYAVQAAAHIRNCMYHQRTETTPIFLLTGSPPKVSRLHVFGSVCFTYIQEKSKLDPRCRKGIFVGYDKNKPSLPCVSSRHKSSHQESYGEIYRTIPI